MYKLILKSFTSIPTMRALVLLFFAIIATDALRPNWEYSYRYEVFIKSGYPEIRHNFSVVALRGHVLFQVIDFKDVRIQLAELEESVGLMGTQGGMNGPMDIHFRRAGSELRTLESPFTCNFEGTEPEIIMKSNQNDLEWQVNMRKALALQLKTNFEDFYETPTSFTRDENTLNGVCSSTYSMEQILYEDFPWAQNNYEVQNEPPEDLCKSGTYNVTRTINFNKCSDLVELQKVGLGSENPFINNQEDSMFSRSSTTSYVVCGQNNRTGYDIFNVTSIGTVLVNPYGINTQKIKTLTNQTLTLLRMNSIKSKLPVPGNPRESHTWSMEISSPFQGGEDSKIWINYTGNGESSTAYNFESAFTGINLDDQKINEYKEHIENTVKRTARLLARGEESAKMNLGNTGNSYAQSAKELSESTQMARALSYDSLNTLYKDLVKSSTNQVKQLTGSLYLDLLGAAGSGPSHQLLTEHMMNDIKSIRTSSLYFTLTNSIASTEHIPLIYKHLKNMSMHANPYATTTAYLNYANLLRRVCVEATSEYAVSKSFLGRAQCNAEYQTMQFVEFLTEKLENAEYIFEKTVHIQALTNLGSVIAIPVLKKAIQGDYGTNTSIRIPALYGLSMTKIQDFDYNEARKILFPLIDNYLEDLQVRQTAVFVLLSYKPSGDVFRKLAQLTWRDPSRQLGSFIYSLLYGISKTDFAGLRQQKAYATHALRQTKSYPPSSVYSYVHMWANRYPNKNAKMFSMFTAIYNNQTMLPGELSHYFFNSFGDFNYPAYYFSIRAFNADDLAIRLYGAYQYPYGTNFPFADRKVGIEWTHQKVYPYQVHLLSRLYDNLEFYAPIDDDILGLLPNNGTNWIQQLLNGTDLTMAKYLDPSNNEYWVPTDPGFPLAIRTTNPMVHSYVGTGKLETSRKDKPGFVDLVTANKTSFSTQGIFNTYSCFQSSVTTLVPWKRMATQAQSERFQNVHLPGSGSFTIKNSILPEGHNKSYSYTMEPIYEQNIELLHAHNVPRISVKGMWSADETIDEEVITVITDETLQNSHFEIPEDYLGFTTNLTFNSDTNNPFNRGTMGDFMKNPQSIHLLTYSPTAKYWDLTISADFTKAKTSSLNATLDTWKPSVLSDASQSNWTNALNSDSSDTRVYPKGTAFRLQLNGKQERYYELSMGTMTRTQDNQYNISTRIVAKRSALPGVYSEPGQACGQFSTLKPEVYDYESFLERLHENDVYEEKKYNTWSFGCHSKRSPDMIFESTIWISDVLRNQILNIHGTNGSYSPENAGEPYFDKYCMECTSDKNNANNSKTMMFYLIDGLEQLASPRFFHTNSHLPKTGNFTMNSNRTINTFTWQTAIQDSFETTFLTLTEYDMPKSSYRVVPSSSYQSLDKYCIINKNGMRTNDFVYVKEPVYVAKNCYTLTVSNRKYYGDFFQLYTRFYNNEPQVILYFPQPSIQFTIKHNSIKSSKTQPKLGPDIEWILYPYLQGYSINGKTTVMIPENLTLTVTPDYIKILPYQSLKGSVSGICGAFNSEFSHEFVGPEYCVYNDYSLFVGSWTTMEGDNCDYMTQGYWYGKVEEFQQSCAYAGESQRYPLLKSHNAPESDCLKYNYPVQKTRYLTCVSTQPVGYCLPKCKLKKKTKSLIPYKCWPTKSMPQDVKYYSARGYTLAQPHSRHDITSSFVTIAADICVF